MDASAELNTRRIVLLGKTGVGRSSTGNTIFGETVFQTSGGAATSITNSCQAESRTVEGRGVTLIDTPGFFHTAMSEEQQRSAIVRCITECSPGPHAFLILLKVRNFTRQEEDMITKITEYFSAEAFTHAALLFTHGDSLKGQTIEDFARTGPEALRDLVEKCGGRCHVLDNKRWNKKLQDGCSRNQVQVRALLSTIDKLVEEHSGGCYTKK